MIILIVALTCFKVATFAESIGWHPSFKSAPGEGLDPRKQDEIKPKVANLDTNLPAYSGTGMAETKAYFAQHKLDLMSSFSLNTSLSLESFFGPSIDTGFDFVDRQNFAENTITFAVVCSRDFGDVNPTLLGMDPDFVNYVQGLKKNLQGLALHNAVTEHYGTHYICGYTAEMKVVVTYTFHFASTSVAQEVRAHLNASYGEGDFKLAVQSFFQRNDSATTLTYDFWTSDPVTPGFIHLEPITTYDDFLTLYNQVIDYANGMNTANSRKMGYILKKIENLPGYLDLIETASVTGFDIPDYSSFLKFYAELSSWKEQLNRFVVDEQNMSWLNELGKKNARGLWADTSNYLNVLTDLAKKNLKLGLPLDAPADVVNYIANFNRLKIPTINTIKTFGVGDSTEIVGYINCGSLAFTVDVPFRFIHIRPDGQDVGFQNFIYYTNAQSFADQLFASTGDAGRPALSTFFQSPEWQAVLHDNPECRVGFFSASCLSSMSQRTSLALKDANLNVVEELNILAGRADPCATSTAASAVDVSLGQAPASTNLFTHLPFHLDFAVTNNGPGAAYGASLSFSVDTNQFNILETKASQGSGDVTNGNFSFYIGPLAEGSVARISITLNPLKPGAASFGLAQLQLGEGLDEVNTNKVPISSVSIESPPRLSFAKTSGQIELKWDSIAASLNLQECGSLGQNQVWTNSSAQIAIRTNSGTHLDLNTPHKFFRLIAH